jgi:hypothetical protein
VDLVQGAQAFQILAAHLKETGEGGLRRNLQKAIRDAAAPVARKIGSTEHLDPYLPDRYAAVLAADLKVTVHAQAGGTNPGITIMARAPTTSGGARGGRAIRRINAGNLRHPVFADRTAPRRSWRWTDQDVRPRFFDDPPTEAAPQIRDKILAAMRDTCDQITRKA